MLWPKQQVQKMIELYQSGISVSDIANKYYCSRSCILRILKVKGVYTRKVHEKYQFLKGKNITLEGLKELYKQGYSLERKSEQVGFSRKTITRFFKESGVEIKRACVMLN